MKNKNIMYRFDFKRTKPFPTISKENLENYTVTCNLVEHFAIESIKKVDELILKQLYQTYLKLSDEDTLLVIDESEFKKFLLKYLPIYLKECEE